MAQIPTPKPFRGAVERLDERCGIVDCVACSRGLRCRAKCERWHATNCAAVIAHSVPLLGTGENWNNAVPLAAAGGRPACNASPFFSRVNVCVPYLTQVPEYGAPNGVPPPKIHLEVRMGDEGVVSRVARLVWTPNGWDDSGDLVEVSGILVTRVEIWGWCELSPDERGGFPLPVEMKFNLLIDRMGGVKDVWYNDLANVVVDTS